MRVGLGGIVATAAALALAGSLSAQPAPGQRGERMGPRGERMGPRGPMERMARYLELTEQQKEQARQLFEAQRPQMEALREKMRDNGERLRQAIESAAPDATLVGELTLEQHRLRGVGKAQREEMQKAFKALLTPEQLKKAEAMEAARELGMGPRGRRPHGPGPWDEDGPGPEGPEPPQPR